MRKGVPRASAGLGTRRIPLLALLASACLTPPRYGTSGDVPTAAGPDAPAASSPSAAAGAARRIKDAKARVCPDSSRWTAESPPGLCTDAAPWTTAGPGAVELRVDAGAPGTAWSRYYEKAVAADHANTLRCTAWGRNAENALRKAHAEAGFQYVRFHGILNDDIGVYSQDERGNPVYDWTRFDQVYDGIAAAGMRPIVEISFTPMALASDKAKVQGLLWYDHASPNVSPPGDWARWKALMAEIVRHLEGRYGAGEVRDHWYFEVWNEPSWMYSLGDAGYTDLYARTVEGLLAGDPGVKVGGPAGSAPESPSLVPALIAASKANHVKLDFITYHRYGNDKEEGADDKEERADANGMLAFHETMARILGANDFTGEVLNDEFGPSSRADISRDTEVAASFIAKTIHLIGTDPAAPPPVAYGYWAISDLYEEFDTGGALAYREGNYGLLLKGDPRFPESFDVAKPAFNAFRLLHGMGARQLPVRGGALGDGVGAAATLSSDGQSLQVLVYNHVNSGKADSSQSSIVSLSVDDLPFAGPLRVRQYVVDRSHANSHTAWVDMGKPTKPTREQWVVLRDSARLCYYETQASLEGRTLKLTFPQNVYSVSLIEIGR